MILVSGTITFDPAKADEARALVEPLVAASLQEPGCKQYGFWTHVSQPGHVRIFEEWESQEAMDAHMETPHLAAFMGSLGGLGITGAELTKYEVADSSKLM
jgi:quinol monooxygenase YgiN